MEAMILCAVGCELAASLGVVASERALAATGCQDLSRVCGSHAGTALGGARLWCVVLVG